MAKKKPKLWLVCHAEHERLREALGKRGVLIDESPMHTQGLRISFNIRGAVVAANDDAVEGFLLFVERVGGSWDVEKMTLADQEKPLCDLIDPEGDAIVFFHPKITDTSSPIELIQWQLGTKDITGAVKVSIPRELMLRVQANAKTTDERPETLVAMAVANFLDSPEFGRVVGSWADYKQQQLDIIRNLK